MIRWKFERDTRFKVPVRVEIHDSEYVGSEITLPFVGASPIERTVGTQNSDYLRKISGSSVAVRLRGKTGDFDDLFDRNNERFRIRVFIDNALEDEFIPVPDTFSEPVTGGNFEVTIQGSNLSLLKQVKIADILDLEGGRLSVLDGIYDILSHYFSMDIVDGSIYYPSGSNQSTSALSQYTFSPSRFENETAYQALEDLIPKGHQIRVSRGKFFIFPCTEASFTGYSYNGTTIGSGVVYDDNFVAEKIGGRLSKQRTRQVSYDGVNSIYDSGETPNLIKNGDIQDAEFVPYVGGSQPLPDLTPLIPEGWDRVAPNEMAGFDSTRSERGDWRIHFPSTYFMGTIPNMESDEGIEIIEGQRLRLSVDASYFNPKEKESEAFLLLQVKVGDYFLLGGQTVVGNRVANLFWSQTPQSSFGDLSSYVGLLVQSGGSLGFEAFSLPLPQTGVLSNKITITAKGYLGSGASGILSKQSRENYIEISSLSLDAVDEDNEIIIRSEDLAGESGEIYDFTEKFGDGFSSVSSGALFLNSPSTPNHNTPTQSWSVKGLSGMGSIASQKAKYLFSELSRHRDRLNGTVDTFDTIALINDKRVNYSKTDYRYGRSEIELVEIAEHNLTATVEPRRERDDRIRVVGPGVTFPPELMPFQRDAIGIITRDYQDELTDELEVETDSAVRVGFDYWVINRFELDPDDRYAGVYQIEPRGAKDQEFSSGEFTLPIEEQLINAPEGSIIVLAPGQKAITDSRVDKRVRDGEENITNLQTDLTQLDVDLAQLDLELTQLEIDLNTLETVTLPNLQAELDDILPITETKITDSAITAPKIAANAVIAGKIAADAVLANSIAAGAIIASKIGAGEVIAEKIGAGAIIAEKIGAGAITTEKIGAGQVTAVKIDVADFYATNATIGAQLLFGTGAILRSGNFNGTFDVNGNITGNGTLGWAIDNAGKAVFSNIVIRGADSSMGDNATLNDLFIFGTLQIFGDGQLVGDNYILDKDGLLVNPDAEFDITLGATSEITNAGADFTLNSSGISFQEGSAGARRVEWYDNTTLKTALYSLNLGTVNGVANTRGIEIQARNESSGNMEVVADFTAQRAIFSKPVFVNNDFSLQGSDSIVDLGNAAYMDLPQRTTNPTGSGGRMFYDANLGVLKYYDGVSLAWISL